jgi:predicted RNA-binding protein YlqC (UPF0109 family)
MGQQVADLLVQELGPVPQEVKSILSSVEEVEQFVAGLFKGLVDKDDLNNIKQCMKDAGTLDTELQTAIADFEKKDVADIIAGAKIVGNMVGQLSTDLSDCKSMSTDVQRVEKWAQIFKNPKALEKLLLENTIKHIGAIKTDITNITSDASSKNYEDLGVQVADLLIQEVGPVPQLGTSEMLELNSVENVEQFVAGLFKGLVDKDDLNNIKTCLKDAGTLDTEMKAAIADFEKKDIADIIAGAKIVGNMVGQLSTDLNDCKGM